MRFCLLLALLGAALAAEPLSKGERDQAMSHLHATRKQVLDVLQSVSDAQWTYKSGPTRWSIAECAEHIAETEVMLRGLVQRNAKTLPLDEAKRTQHATAKDAAAKAVLTQMTDRSKPASAPQEVRPTGRFASRSALISAFSSRRDETIHYVESTQDDLRGRFFSMGPDREMDLYEMILMISGHAERHLLQMKEVMATAGYPKK